VNEDRHKQEVESFYDDYARRLEPSKLLGSKYLSSWKRGPYLFVEDYLNNNIKNDSKILDAACGDAFLSLEIIKHGKNRKLYGVDISDAFLFLAKENASNMGLEEYSSFMKGDIENIDLPDKMFDVMICIGSLSYVDYEKVFQEANRLLNENGEFIIIDTLGHNPILNLNRQIKLARGKKISRQVKNVLKIEDFQSIEGLFSEVEYHYFDFLTLLMSPFGTNFETASSRICKILRVIDGSIFKSKLLRKLAFKIVCIARRPIYD